MAPSTAPVANETLFLAHTLLRLVTPDFLSRGIDWRDADGDGLAVWRLKGFRSLSGSYLCFWLDRAVALH